jgi:sodium-dependent phosphate transporter
VANAYASSVGAGSITLKQAVVLAVIFEFLGAVTMGSSVSETVRSGIADPACFEDNPGLLMWGMTCVILCVGVWLVLASYLEMPVSTTHSCIGGIIGMTMMSRNVDCVLWYEETDDFPFVKGVVAIFISWVLSPVASGLCAACIYLGVYFGVLNQTSDVSFRNAKIFFPFLVAFTMFVNTMYLILKGTSGKKEEFHTKEMVDSAKAGDLGPAAIPSAIVAAIFFVVTALAVPYMAGKAQLAADAIAADASAEAAKPKGSSLDVEMEKLDSNKAPRKGGGTPKATAENPIVEDTSMVPGAEPVGEHGLFGFVKGQMEQDVYASLKSDAVVGGIHDRVKRHDARTEELFKYVQVFTAIVDSFSHGANDVANAMGPFIAVYMTWKNGEVAKKTEVGDDIYWILAIGGAGIAVGLSTYGYKIMNAIGVKLTAITPSRGFCIELGAAFVVIYGTGQGWPLSTTHCQVGATVGVGLFEGAQGINGWVLGKTVVGWVITLVVVGLSAAILVGPSPEPDYDLFCSTGEGLDAR